MYSYISLLEKEYAARYLESIDSAPTKDNVEYILDNLPLKDALVLPVWIRDKILIIPGI